MTDILEQTHSGDMMEGLDVGMLPTNLGLNMNPPDSQAYGTVETHLDSQQQQTNDASDGPNTVNSNTLTGAGAGPLPTGFGTQTSANGGSTLTDFTKRRNWSQRVLEELKDFLHILTPDGRILYVSPSGRHLTGYDPDELIGKFIVDFIHPDRKSVV